MEQKNSFLTNFLSILLIISVCIAGFFAWKTQKLVKEIRSLKEAPKASTTPSPKSEIDWKTYTNSKYTFQLKYPEDFKIDESIYKNSDNGLKILSIINPLNKNELVIEIWNSLEEISKYRSANIDLSVHETQDKKFISLSNFKSDPLLTKISSSFEFIETTKPTPFSVDCTMDAKICPDGSSVGRTGPKCEFNPCPTPKP